MRIKSFLKNKFVWLLGIFIFLVGRISSGYFSEGVKIYTSSKVRNYAEGLIAQCVDEKLLHELQNANILVENYDSNGKVSYAYANSFKINEIRNSVILYTDEAINKINLHSDFDLIEVPFGYFFGIKYFLNNGVKIPISLEVIGNQDVEIKIDTLSRGINTTIIEIYLDISIDIQVVIPFQNNVTTTKTKIPIALEIMNNEIPYYLGDIIE